MKLCILTTSYPRSQLDDTSVFISRLSVALSDNIEQQVIIVPYDQNEALTESLHSEQIIVHRFCYGIFRAGRLAFGSGLLQNLQRNPLLILQVPAFLIMMTRTALIKAKNSQHIHAHWILAGVSAWIIHLLTGKPYSVGLLGSDMLLMRIPLLSILLRFILKPSQYVITASETFRQQCINQLKLDPNKIVTIENGIQIATPTQDELVKVRERLYLTSTSKVLCSVATLRPLKRIECLLEILAQPELCDFTLLLCGKTDDIEYLATLQQKIEELSLSKRVIVCGAVPPNEVAHYLGISAGYITASAHEGRPNAPLEAMAAGCIVFASDIKAHKEIITQGETGFLFDPSHPPLAAQMIANTLSDKSLCLKIQQKQKDYIANYSWQACAQKYLKCFNYTQAKLP